MKYNKYELIKILPLILMIEQKKSMQNTVIVEQEDTCKFVYWAFKGTFQILRKIKFIDKLNRPLRE